MPNFCPLFQGIGGWLITLIAMFAGIVFIIDMARHALSDQRNYGAAGKDGVGLIAMIVIGTQSGAIVNTALGWMGVAATCSF